MLAFRALGVSPDDFVPDSHPLTDFISNPDFFSFFVAFVAGIAGMLSLTSAKSGALIGVLISVTTIPAAANIGVAAAYGDAGRGARAPRASWPSTSSAIVLAGVLTLFLQRRFYVAPAPQAPRWTLRATAAGLPLGRSARKAHR